MLHRGRPWSLLDDPRALVRLPLRLLLSVAAAGLALWVVGALEPFLGAPALFPAFVGIVFVAAEVAGTSYGVLTMLLFGCGYAFFFQEPRRGFGVEDPHALAVLAVYAVAGSAVAGLGGAVRKALARARKDHRAVATMHEQREDLLKTLTHDLRSPLNVITMNAAMLQRDPKDPAVVLRRARAIDKSAASMAGMLSDLVDTAHLESGHLPLHRTPVDLASYVVELKSRLEGTLTMDRVSFAIPGNLPAAHVDPRRFERILVNLLSNALKYAPSPTPVVLGASVQDGSIVVSVADSGPGISQQDLPHIFEKYYRASGTRKKEGLGLGLYGTRLLVQAHGGRIWVDSELGRGTTFHVALPTAPSEARPPAASAPLAAGAPARGAIEPPGVDGSG